MSPRDTEGGGESEIKAGGEIAKPEKPSEAQDVEGKEAAEKLGKALEAEVGEKPEKEIAELIEDNKKILATDEEIKGLLIRSNNDEFSKGISHFLSLPNLSGETINNVGTRKIELYYKDSEGNLARSVLDPREMKGIEWSVLDKKHDNLNELDIISTETLRGPIHEAIKKAGFHSVEQGYGVLFKGVLVDDVLKSLGPGRGISI